MPAWFGGNDDDRKKKAGPKARRSFANRSWRSPSRGEQLTAITAIWEDGTATRCQRHDLNMMIHNDQHKKTAGMSAIP
jgi:hypothetical protein